MISIVFIYFICGAVVTQEVWAREEQVAEEKFAGREEDGDQCEIKCRGFLVSTPCSVSGGVLILSGT